MNHDELIAEIEEKIKELAPRSGGQFYSGTFRKALAALAAKEAKIAELEAELAVAKKARDGWHEEARTYCLNVNFWSEKYEAAFKRAEAAAEELLRNLSNGASCFCWCPRGTGYDGENCTDELCLEARAHLDAVAKGKEDKS